MIHVAVETLQFVECWKALQSDESATYFVVTTQLSIVAQKPPETIRKQMSLAMFQ